MNLMQMNIVYIYIYLVDFLHDMNDDDHVLILMLIYVDNVYNKKFVMNYFHLIDVE